MDYESWRCSRDSSKFCPIEGCPAWYGCARDHSWKPGDPSPRECQNMAPKDFGKHSAVQAAEAEGREKTE